MAVTGKRGVGIPSIVLHEGEGTIVTIGTPVLHMFDVHEVFASGWQPCRAPASCWWRAAHAWCCVFQSSSPT